VNLTSPRGARTPRIYESHRTIAHSIVKQLIVCPGSTGDPNYIVRKPNFKGEATRKNGRARPTKRARPCRAWTGPDAA